MNEYVVLCNSILAQRDHFEFEATRSDAQSMFTIRSEEQRFRMFHVYLPLLSHVLVGDV